MCCAAPEHPRYLGQYTTVFVRNTAPERRSRRREQHLLAIEARIEERAYHSSQQRNSEEMVMWDRSSQRLEREYRNVRSKTATHASRAR